MIEIRCSNLSRIMACAGPLSLTNLLPDQENDAAKEGTAAGECLRSILECVPVPSHASNGVPIDDEMKFWTKPIVEFIAKRATSPVLCEQRIDWQTRSGIMIRGQYDASYTEDNDTTLAVDDLKYGWGLVEPFENWQLLGYLIGETMRRGKYFNKYVGRIHQPRPHHENGPTREWSLTYEELFSYKEKIEQRMDQIALGDRTLVTGPQCKYCPGAAEGCAAFNKMFYRGIEVVHEFTQDSITDQELSFQLDLITRVNDVMKIKYDSIKSLAVERIRSGKLIPNWVTESSYGDRKWKADVSADVIKMMTGKDIIKQDMLSPAQAEKAGVPSKLVNQLVDRPFLGQKLKKKDTTKLGNEIFGTGEPKL